MCNRRGQCPKAHDPGYVRELRSDLIERLFCESALRHVLSRADGLEPTILVADHLTERAQVLDPTVRHPQPEIVLVRSVVGSNLFPLLNQHRNVFRVN
jgi:hypothetical protein